MKTEMVSIAKRENNNKRKYLVVNRLQGKHIPVSGKTAFNVFDTLAKCVEKSYNNNEKLLLVGFAETATAIGARLAVTLGCDYMQTTREQIDNVEYLYFTESHSHATEQKLVRNDIDSVIDGTDRIVFVEDEVTTGNTIMKIVDIIEKLYPDKVKFSVASLLNGMDEEAVARYNARDIDVHYLVKTDHSTYTEIADCFKGDGEYINKDVTDTDITVTDITEGYLNTRRLVGGTVYNTACQKLFEEIKKRTNLNGVKTMAVIGTEEFMYPALYVAEQFENLGISAFSHSTTRSPIVTSTEEDYPVQKRFELASFYDVNRKTFIYNLKKYDCVIVITDSTYEDLTGVNTLVNALKSVGNDNINVYRWCRND